MTRLDSRVFGITLLAVVGRLIVLNFGRKIAEGHPRTVMNSPEVRQIYMGIEA